MLLLIVRRNAKSSIAQEERLVTSPNRCRRSIWRTRYTSLSSYWQRMAHLSNPSLSVGSFIQGESVDVCPVRATRGLTTMRTLFTCSLNLELRRDMGLLVLCSMPSNLACLALLRPCFRSTLLAWAAYGLKDMVLKSAQIGHLACQQLPRDLPHRKRFLLQYIQTYSSTLSV